MREVGVLEVGGSHVTAAVVRGEQVESVRRRTLDPAAPADDLIAALSTAITTAPVPSGTPWAVALPGPFDYAEGIGRYTGVGKFDALNGVDVGKLLREATGVERLLFLNDADAFAVGEWAAGVGGRARRCVGITLGSGVGSGFLEQGVPVTSGSEVPPEGEVHFVRVDGVDLEDLVSRRAILGRYRSRADADPGADVRELFVASRAGDEWARTVLADAFGLLGRALAPWLRRFGAEVVMVGGGMAAGWDLVEPALAAAIGPDIPARRSADPVRSALVGAAVILGRSEFSPGS